MFTPFKPSSPIFSSVSWKHYVALWNLSSVLQNKHVTKNDIYKIHELVENYLRSYIVFRDYMNERYSMKLTVTPKHLWVMSYSRIISHVGSLATLDTNIGESKNYQMKKHSQMANQSRNTIKTIAIREARRFAFFHSTSNLKNQTVPFEESNFELFSESLSHFLQTNDICPINYDFFEKTKYLSSTFRSSEMCGVIYQKHSQTLFGVILTMAYPKDRSNMLFIVQKTNLFTVPNLCLKRCEITTFFDIFPVCDLLYERPVYVYSCLNSKKQDELYVSIYK